MFSARRIYPGKWLVGLLICLTAGLAGVSDSLAAGSFYIKGGEFVPEIKNLDLNYNFSGDGIWMGEAGLGFRPYRFLELGINVGGNRYLVPIGIDVACRCAFMKDQVLMPYVSAGLDAYGLRDKDVVLRKNPGLDPKSWQYGYHGAIGLQVLLDYFSPRQAARMYNNWGIKNTYLNLEAKFSTVDNFGQEKLDYGGDFYSVGLAFEF